MIIAVDFDGTIVEQEGRDYEDVATPLVFLPGARAGLHALKRARHLLLLWSGRANLALLSDPHLDPLVRAGAKRVDVAAWKERQPIHVARYEQMLRFEQQEMAGLFDAIDDGKSGKPMVDLFIDDKAIRFGEGLAADSWISIASRYGA